jgi:hypothetical protein
MRRGDRARPTLARSLYRYRAKAGGPKHMRAVVGCAIVSVVLLVGGGRAVGVPAPKFAEPSCEEKCRLDGERDAAACDARPLQEGDRALCHDTARARLDVCLRICDD